jgi:hypothetical protein
MDLAQVWERHAAWWQAEFTGGADVEYEEQILPWPAACWREPGACSTGVRRRPDRPAGGR